ncbi:MAG: hypothetical protein ABI565_09720 [Vicinamibacteria bacterium]
MPNPRDGAKPDLGPRKLRRPAVHPAFRLVCSYSFNARISTDYAVPLTDSACVYYGNRMGVGPREP